MCGVEFRHPEDDTLWEEHGVETVDNFAHMAMYLTHDTEQAIQDGKTRYELKEIVSNLDPEEIKQIREGYIRVSTQTGKVGNREMAQLDTLAYELGQKLEDFSKWYGNLDFMTRSHAKMRTVRESYYRGVQDRVNMNGEVNRLCIFIQGEPNVGKTYATEKALKGKQVLKIGGGGTGKFDRLLPSHDAIIVDDDTVENLLNMTDNYMCQAYKRQKDNPYWCGEYFIVTSNLSFEEWVEQCRITTQEYGIETAQYRAIKSRFYICHIGETEDKKTRVLMCTSPSTRGSKEDQKARLAKYIEFRKKVNESLASYTPQVGEVDYSELNGEWKESSTPEEIQQLQSKNNDPYAGWFDRGSIKKEDVEYFESKGFKLEDDGLYILNSEKREYYFVDVFY